MPWRAHVHGRSAEEDDPFDSALAEPPQARRALELHQFDGQAAFAAAADR